MIASAVAHKVFMCVCVRVCVFELICRLHFALRFAYLGDLGVAPL